MGPNTREVFCPCCKTQTLLYTIINAKGSLIFLKGSALGDGPRVTCSKCHRKVRLAAGADKGTCYDLAEDQNCEWDPTHPSSVGKFIFLVGLVTMLLLVVLAPFIVFRYPYVLL